MASALVVDPCRGVGRTRTAMARVSRWSRPGVIGLVLTALIVASCSKASQSGPQSFANYAFHPSPSATWPSFPAQDYRTSSGHSLRNSDVALIRKTLALIKPCQRAILRYAFPSNPEVVRFVLFFQTAILWPHVLWTRNLYFKRDVGEVFALSGNLPFSEDNIRFEIENTQACGKM